MKILNLFLTIFFIAGNAFAELQVFPLRVVLSEKERAAQISLRHKGNKPERYRITAVFYKMGPDGSMTLVEKTRPEDQDGRNYFRFSPRQVTLAPNIEQVVRVVTRLPAQLEDGEYRCHLHFESMTENDNSNIAEEKTATGARMLLKANMAVAIPVIIKKGTAPTKVSITNFKVNKEKDNKFSFSAEMSKEGKGFTYGNIEIVSTSEKGDTQILSTINGISNYISKRTLKFPLQASTIPKGKIQLLFKDPNDQNEKVLATAETVFSP
ncbi:MAG: hypothetical protein ACXVCP_12890 [Bdellovibrio sp.]